MPRVWHVKAHEGLYPADAVYVGRGSKWGNRFTHLPLESTKAEVQVATVEEAISCFERDLDARPDLLAALPELAGKDLLCWCVVRGDEPCHARVLLKRANSLNSPNTSSLVTPLGGLLIGGEAVPFDVRARLAARPRIALDLETWPIGPGAIFPRPVCATFAEIQSAEPLVARSRLVARGDPEWGTTFEEILAWLEGDLARQVVCQNGHGFDLPVIAIHYPHLLTRIFDALERGQFRDTITREKLLNLATTGNIDYYFTPDGVPKDIRYDLGSLAAKYLGIDRSAEKGVDKDGNHVRTDIWRLHFNTLDGLPSSAYPREAAEYAQEDARDALLIAHLQDERAWLTFERHGAVGHDGGPFDVFRTEPLHVAAMFCLSLATYEGFGVDRSVVEHMEREVEKALRPEQTYLLYESGLMSRPEPVRPYAKGVRHGPPNLQKPCTCAASTHDEGTPKMKDTEPAHLSKKMLTELVVKTWAANRLCDDEKCPKFNQECPDHGLPSLKRTEPSKTHPEGQISCDGEVIADLAAFNPVLAQYDHFTIVGKLQTLEIPRLREALAHGGTIHGGFSEIKKTGRVGSNRSKFYPSTNIQQIPRAVEVDELGPDFKPLLDVKGKKKIIRIEPRHAYVPRIPGWVLVSIDYAFIELVSHAQRMKNVIGYSVLADKINKGFDPHAFLGAQLAVGLDADFAEHCRLIAATEADDVYRAFVHLKAGTDDQKKFYKLWRNFSKPVGLGYPGGLGPRTLISVAKKVYGVTIKSIEQAKSFKDVWLASFPENREYLQRYVRDNLKDEVHTSSERERFACFSPLGMYRCRMTFTEAANGFSLQGPSAEGMKLALCRLQRACWDQMLGSCLYGCRVVAAIHDEAILAIPDDSWLHERAFEAARLWIEGMKVICPDVNVKAEPAAMRCWNKNAEPCYRKADGRLLVWEPDMKYETDDAGRLWSA